MTYTAHNPGPLYAAIVTRLETQTGAAIGRSEAPTGAAKALGTTAYAVVHPILESFEGSIGDPHQIDVYLFQVTSVGGSAAHAQAMQHAVRAALVGWAPTVTGRATTKIRLADGSGIARDDGVQPPAFFSTDRYEIFTS